MDEELINIIQNIAFEDYVGISDLQDPIDSKISYNIKKYG